MDTSNGKYNENTLTAMLMNEILNTGYFILDKDTSVIIKNNGGNIVVNRAILETEKNKTMDWVDYIDYFLFNYNEETQMTVSIFFNFDLKNDFTVTSEWEINIPKLMNRMINDIINPEIKKYKEKIEILGNASANYKNYYDYMNVLKNINVVSTSVGHSVFSESISGCEIELDDYSSTFGLTVGKTMMKITKIYHLNSLSCDELKNEMYDLINYIMKSQDSSWDGDILQEKIS